MERIIVSASEMWNYFQKHKAELGKTEHIVATNEDYGVTITVSEERGLPCFIVTADDYQYAEESAVSERDCVDTVNELYQKYLSGKFIDDEYEDSLLDEEDMISERENELDEAFMLLFETLLYDIPMFVVGEADLDSVIEDVKDHVCEYLYRKHGISVYRPMMLEDEDTGEDFFAERPYENIAFDDE